ncbi:hypothetical protein BASA50_005221 [Batrachochytrium salamandrivorans]|uniref:LSM complex subunit LSM4 n=1 Tax=Batrachochytrium salamandrivorans TaxID=1357716 RepID=A0ABQ8FD25_9FUNG|nr:hypothetical protein BASA62_004582 [Batrachochytrium salamandrivorans]KAH6578093.1 hypothetical protein BASA60_003795 [Batrachochytrium salamandrivorans]KAH6593916.1 hypothetical protein BASA61_004135 [Batrachochytrium salamandrivorans]KAH6596181.1 hypothetical protein BASA50_005221 [Batrachochytrium salamandrivorans]KAH9272043.1 hypothetical protein BASA83_005630 [Batrachochytrium salamandrivorans]
MLPLSLLNKAQGHPMLIELKNGDTFNGHLVNCDPYMNVNLREVIRTSADGEQFWKIPEIYIRGSTIKYLRVPDEILDILKEEQNRPRQHDDRRGGFSGGGGRGSSSGGYRGGHSGNDNSSRGGGRGGRGGSRDGNRDHSQGSFRGGRGGTKQN